MFCDFCFGCLFCPETKKTDLITPHFLKICLTEAEEELAALRKTIETQQLTITEQMVALEDCTCNEQRQNYSDAHVSTVHLELVVFTL